MNSIQWVQHAGLYPLKSRCGRFQVACYHGSHGARYLAWYKPRGSTPRVIEKMRLTLEEARADAEQFVLQLVPAA